MEHVDEVAQHLTTSRGVRDFTYPHAELLERWIASASDGDTLAYLRLVAVGYQTVPENQQQADMTNRCRQLAVRLEPQFRRKEWNGEGTQEIFGQLWNDDRPQGTEATINGVEGKLYGFTPFEGSDA